MKIKLLGGLDGHERKGGGIQTGYQVFDPCGLCPTLLTDMGGYGIMIAEIKVIGRMDHTIDNTHESANRVYSQYGLCPTIPTCAGGNIQPKILEGEENLSERQNGIKAKKMPNGNIRFYQDDEKKSAISELQVQSGADVAQTITTANVPKIYEEKQIVAMRGRNPENPKSRKPGLPTEQRLELNNNGTCNTLTTVQKDNLVLEKVGVKQATKKGFIECEVGGVCDLSYTESKTRRGRVQSNGNVSPTITAESNGLCKIENHYRIRKLTPRECWRLMGFSDEDFEKAEKVNSNTQLYKQAGNSIVKDVLMAIFLQLLYKKD